MTRDFFRRRSALTSLRLDFTMGDWADALVEASASASVHGHTGGACSLASTASVLSPPTGHHTPLAPLRQAPCLLYFDLMLVDSTEGSEGLLDNRLINDLAEIERLEEVSVRSPIIIIRGGTQLD